MSDEPEIPAATEPAPEAEAAPAIAMPTDDEIRALQRERDEAVIAQMSSKTRRAFLAGGIAAIAGAATWRWLDSSPREEGVSWPFRRMLRANERLSEAYFSPARLSPTFRPGDVTKKRINGHLGLTETYDVSQWNLTIEGSSASASPIVLTMDDVMKLPKREMITELRCIEGWSMIVKWTGTRLADLMAKYPPPNRDGSRGDVASADRLVRYVAMETPGRGYFVGLDMASALHPQTLLAWALNDTLLDWHHGAPLRLAIPVKYGIKNIKRPTVLRYTDIRPADYWAQQGYDFYAGH
jgi:DMSO/TMAO reductase YedYZ molybdopterin-dependent catalytic subunit